MRRTFVFAALFLVALDGRLARPTLGRDRLASEILDCRDTNSASGLVSKRNVQFRQELLFRQYGRASQICFGISVTDALPAAMRAAADQWREVAVKLLRQHFLWGIALTLASVGVVVSDAPPASADCTNAGAATVCAQGTVRGGGPTAPQAGPVYPGYCADPWYCSDDWGIDISLGPIRPGRPGGGGGGGGIGPR